MRVLDLFSGIGAFSLGLERAGFTTVAFCEIAEFPRRVLAKHWPGVPIFDDVRTLTRERLVDTIGTGIDVITAGFPCQDISLAGSGAGLDGERSGLWSEVLRLVGELRPKFLVVENSSALLNRGLGRILGGLAAIGYDAEWHCVPASRVGAPHIRDRIWIVAYPDTDSGRLESVGLAQHAGVEGARGDLADGLGPAGRRHWPAGESPVADAAIPRLEILLDSEDVHQGAPSFGVSPWASESGIRRVAFRTPDRVHRLEALGNSLVPQIVTAIGRAIMEAESNGR